MYSYCVCIFLCYVIFKILYKFWHVFFYSYNFNIFIYLCRVHIIFHIVMRFLLYFNYFYNVIFIWYNCIIFKMIKFTYTDQKVQMDWFFASCHVDQDYYILLRRKRKEEKSRVKNRGGQGKPNISHEERPTNLQG